jgi:hypothetical protein
MGHLAKVGQEAGRIGGMEGAGAHGLRCGIRSRKAASSILSRISLLTGFTTGMERRSAASTVRGTCVQRPGAHQLSRG